MRTSIVGASGYAGGELLRLLLGHPEVELHQVTSNTYAGKPVTIVHPNLRDWTKLRFSKTDELEETDLLFTALPHGRLLDDWSKYEGLAPRLIDLSGDFRLSDPEDYQRWYGREHPRPELLKEFVYGIVELHRPEMAKAKYISSAGCNATSVILPLYPLVKRGMIREDWPIVSEAKCGSSEGGKGHNAGSHHPERSGCVRSYKPIGHRHTAEMIQELGTRVEFSATSIEMIRGILSTSHVFFDGKVEEKDLWKAYRADYGNEPFLRIVKERRGIYRYPEPKLLAGTNYCDIGFEVQGERGVIIGAIDNLMKGAAGQAVQAMNVMLGFDEAAGLEFPGLHPI